MINQVPTNTVNNNNVFAPFQTAGANFSITKPLTKEQKKELEFEKEKKSNALGAWIASTALIAGLAVFALTKGLPKSWLRKIDGWFKQLEAKAAKIKQSSQTSRGQKIYLDTMEKAKKLAPKTKGIFNFGTIKDAATKEAMNKTSFTRGICNGLTNFFEKISVRTSKLAYLKLLNRLDDFNGNVSELTSKLPTREAEMVKALLEKINKTSDVAFRAPARNQRLKETKADMDGLHKKVKDKLLNIKTSITDRDTYTAFVAEDIVAGSKTKLNNKLAPHKKIIDDSTNEMLNIFKNSNVLSEKEILRLEKNIAELQKRTNKAVKTEGDLLFDKIRDLEIGSAPTDVLGILTSLGIIGWGLTKADNKDERISVLLKSGIPVIGAMIISLICTVGLVSGGASLAIGIGSGLLINKIGEFFDKRRKMNKEEPTNIKDDIKKIILPDAIVPQKLEKLI